MDTSSSTLEPIKEHKIWLKTWNEGVLLFKNYCPSVYESDKPIPNEHPYPHTEEDMVLNFEQSEDDRKGQFTIDSIHFETGRKVLAKIADRSTDDDGNPTSYKFATIAENPEEFEVVSVFISICIEK